MTTFSYSGNVERPTPLSYNAVRYAPMMPNSQCRFDANRFD
jgi:hypothetical protein